MIHAKIEERIKDLARIFQGRGKNLYLVGGSVRDRLLGRIMSDVDLTTDALPAEVKELASQVSPEALYLVGEKFGTIGLIFGKTKVEITTFRAETYRPLSRWPEVAFTSALDEDLWRRDFTINALAQDPITGEFIDPTGGRQDLDLRLIRAVGEPGERFAEDPLRLLRAVRFAAQLGFKIEDKTARAIEEQAGMLSTVSAERIGEEINRILMAPHPNHGLRLARELGLLGLAIPELLPLEAVPQGPSGPPDAFAHSLAAVGRVRPLLDLRWAALLHDIAKPRTLARDETGLHFHGHQVVGGEIAAGILSRLRLDRRTTNTVAKLARMHMRPLQYEGDWTDGALRRLMIDAGADLGKLMELARADLLAHDGEGEEEALAALAELEARCLSLGAQHDVPNLKSPLNGRELITLFQEKPGQWVRRVKEHLLEQVLDGSLAQDDKEAAKKLAREYMGEAFHTRPG